MKALIAGCGYVGLALGAQLAREGHTVCGVRRHSAGTRELEAVGIQPLIADITRFETLAEIPADFDWAVHCASASGGGREDYLRIYVEGNRNLQLWLAGSRLRKYVYTSSTGVYAQDDGAVVEESGPTEPQSETGKILLQAEQLLLKAASEAGFPAVILRVAGIYGPGRGYWLRQFLSGEATLEGDGRRRLNMVHRDDVAGAIASALQKGVPGQIYNVVDNQPPTQAEVFEWLSRTLGRPMPPSVPETQLGPGRRAVTNKIISNRRLRSELGWAPKFPSFREGYQAELKALGLG